ncbi:MAG: efflux RND transporter periplasmic adaptor subunit [Oligoflexia bacterium]|nr:efflux RND transporter periplasmic adaptor subunit [Oligoflexia bacterium]
MEKTKRNPKKIAIAVVVLLLLGGLLTKVFILKPEFRYTGTIEATKVDVPSRLPSVIAKITAEEGQKVARDESLVRLDCEDLKIASDLATSNFQRALKLFKTGSMPQEAYDQTRNRKRETDLKLEWCDIKAPISGRVLTRYREPGEWVTQGTRLLTLADLEDVWAYLYVPQPLIAKLKLGMSVAAYLPELGARKSLEGRILKINEEAEFTPKNVQTREERTRLVFGIKVGFENRDELLKPGMSVEVKLPE